MKIGLVGDTHGRDIHKIKAVCNCDLIIVLGDFGFSGKRLDELNKLLEENNKTLLFVDGNHERFNKLKGCREVELYGNRVRRYANRVFNLQRGMVYTIGGKKFLSFGGAMSIDRHLLTEGLDWFSEEEYSELEKNRLQDSLIANNYEIDYIVSHDCPRSILSMIYTTERPRDSRTSSLLENIAMVSKYDEWFFGHHHIDRRIGKYVCLWNDVYILEI